MALTIRVPKTNPELGRKAAFVLARDLAEADGHQHDDLRNANIRLERIEDAPWWEYVVEFPDASPRPPGANPWDKPFSPGNSWNR